MTVEGIIGDNDSLAVMLYGCGIHKNFATLLSSIKEESLLYATLLPYL